MDDELSIKPVKKWIREGTERQKHEEIKADLNKMKQAILKKEFFIMTIVISWLMHISVNIPL